MTVLLVIALLGRIACSSASSLIQKQLVRDGLVPTRVVAWSLCWLLLLATPSLLWNFSTYQNFPTKFWFAISMAGFLDAVGNILLVRAMGKGELSVVGPLNSYKPLVGLLFGIVWLGEYPKLLGVVGILVTIVGSLMIASKRSVKYEKTLDAEQVLSSKGSVPSNSAMVDRFCSIFFTAIASIFLKQAINVSDTVSAFNFWAIFMTLATWVAVPFVTLPMRSLAPPKLTRVRIFVLGVSFFVLQYLTVWIFGKMPVGYALALFQLGSLVQVYLGYRFFAEKDLRRRMIAAAIMTVGAALILLS